MPKLCELDMVATREQVVEGTCQAILLHLASFKNHERENLFAAIKSSFCIHCGREQPKPGRKCQCWNDE